MGKTREIKPVSNNDDKRRTYRTLKGKLSRALREEFYLEAMLIDYALMEDRLRSYLYYMGILTDRSKTSVNRNIKGDIVSIVDLYKSGKENTILKINSISGKLEIVRSSAKWSSMESHAEDSDYLQALNKVYENIDAGCLLDILDRIDAWRKYRNEVIHSLMNKNIESLDSRLKQKAYEGKELAEQLDNQLRQLKKGNHARKYLRLKDC